jgi:hypothetical protein
LLERENDLRNEGILAGLARLRHSTWIASR